MHQNMRFRSFYTSPSIQDPLQTSLIQLMAVLLLSVCPTGLALFWLHLVSHQKDTVVFVSNLLTKHHLQLSMDKTPLCPFQKSDTVCPHPIRFWGNSTVSRTHLSLKVMSRGSIVCFTFPLCSAVGAQCCHKHKCDLPVCQTASAQVISGQKIAALDRKKTNILLISTGIWCFFFRFCDQEVQFLVWKDKNVTLTLLEGGVFEKLFN